MPVVDIFNWWSTVQRAFNGLIQALTDVGMASEHTCRN